mgnify:CR=1 FL=1
MNQSEQAICMMASLYYQDQNAVSGLYCEQGTKLTFLARSHLAPKISKVVAKAKMLGAIKKKKIAEKTHHTVSSNGRVFLALK